jgi:hypothetical protein
VRRAGNVAVWGDDGIDQLGMAGFIRFGSDCQASTAEYGPRRLRFSPVGFGTFSSLMRPPPFRAIAG